MVNETKPSFAKGSGRARETIIISLGGSLVAPGEIDLGFLKNFKHSLQKYLPQKRFFILVGGGKIARIYQKAFWNLAQNLTTEIGWELILQS